MNLRNEYVVLPEVFFIGSLLEKFVLMNEESVSRTINRLCHEIIENNSNCKDVVLIGIHNRGVPISQRIQNKIKELIGIDLQRGSLDITFHRDDYRERLVVPELMGTDINFSLDGKIVVLVDDVLYSGRTVRAALDELNSFGRASKVQLAVLVDRGHRELPIKPDFVGKNVPTHEGEHVDVTLRETDENDSVFLIRNRD